MLIQLSNISPRVNALEEVYTAFAIAAQLYFFARWTVKRIDHYRQTQRFIEQMRTNHLPHIYAALKALCDKQGVHFEEPDSEV